MNELEWEFVSGREDQNGEINPNERYRIYRLRVGDSEAELLGTCADEEAVGVTICQMGRDGQFDPSNGDTAIGILDTMGEKGKKWIVRPWLASPSNVKDAARLLASKRK